MLFTLRITVIDSTDVTDQEIIQAKPQTLLKSFKNLKSLHILTHVNSTLMHSPF